ncbi:MAG: hypothetical protein KBS52_06130 [Clostridiales bacterium]|nr:hypothetical protein [Candidatus Equinaster intestinalis]
MENTNNSVANVLGFTADKVMELNKQSSVMSEPVLAPDGSTVLTVSELSIGFAGGGSDIKTKKNTEAPAGAGGKITVKPKAVVVINGSHVKVKSVNESPAPALIESAAGLIKGFIKKNK